jgi:5-methylcytosine-specific restriction endonuclease McrA
MSIYVEPPPSVDQQSVYDQVMKEFTCNHPTVVLTRFTKSNNTLEFRKQCSACGESLGCVKKATLSATEIDALPEWDRTIGERRRRAWSDRYAAVRAEREADRDREWHEWFRAYLRSPRWACKRQEVLDRERGICQGCRQSKAVEVHHTTYAHVGDEPLFELVALCPGCHRKVHGRDE